MRLLFVIYLEYLALLAAMDAQRRPAVFPVPEEGVLLVERVEDRVQGRLAEVRRDGAFVEIVEHNLLGTAAARAESFLVQQRPGLLIGLPDLCGSFYRST